MASLLGAVASWHALWAIPVVFLSALCFSGPAIVIACFSPGYDFFNYYFTLAVTPMFVLGGVFYPVSSLPDFLQVMVNLLPLTHAVDIIRPLIAGTELKNIGLHISVLVIYVLVFYYLAVVLVRRKLIV